MSAPVLSVSEQKTAISGKKKKKKTMKNVLGIPSNLKVEIQFAEGNETKKLSEILKRLLPSAKLPAQLDPKNESKEQMDRTEFSTRRKELSLGVNDLSRNIKKALIAAVLIAADVQPKFLIHHINLLCSHNKIPYLHMPGLRDITKTNLGFPCIAVGFKKDFSFFSEVIEEIKSIAEGKKDGVNDTDEESEVESYSEESDKEEVENLDECTKPAFEYLLRSSKTERIFIPEKSRNKNEKTKSDFIQLSKDDNEISIKNKQPNVRIKSNKVKKQKINKINLNDDDDDDDEDEDLEVPKKKIKKDWVIDKVGERSRYYPTNYVRVPSNPNRSKKK